ncbi:MAG: hypothetical protein H0U95_07265 [Bacteroidetes bacterium]|nr:hypothetical protein [Bacteroidota bacterium]
MDFKNIILITVIFLMFFFGCKKKNTKSNAEHPVPYVPVNITIYPNDPLNFKIQAIGGWIYINGGINGIIIYRKSQQEFVALERTSSYLPDNANAKAKVMSDNFTCRDSISDSRWQIFDGGVTQGPAQWGLRVYGTSYDGNALKIKN